MPGQDDITHYETSVYNYRQSTFNDDSIYWELNVKLLKCFNIYIFCFLYIYISWIPHQFLSFYIRQPSQQCFVYELSELRELMNVMVNILVNISQLLDQ